MSYRQPDRYPGGGGGGGYGQRDHYRPPARGRQQLNYDDLDGDASGLPPPRYPRGGPYEADRNGSGGYRDRREDYGRGYPERRRSRSPPPPRRDRDDYSHSHRDRERERDSRPSRRSPSPLPGGSSFARRRSPSRSRSPPRRRRDGSRSPSPPRRRGERERSSPPPPRGDGRDRERSKSLVTADDAADVDTQDIAALMGFGGFGTTQGKAHEGELSGAQVKRERAHRQYMNRKGGFNRPLDKIK
ncbi:hypothetical protein JCM11491_006259 [Sporobolomyces phaffii]